MQDPWPTRRASLRDRDAIADLCRATLGPEDYVLDYLDDLLLRWVTFVALDDDRIVGAMTYHEVLDGTAWLSAARTHPDFQRQGVAAALVRAFEGLAEMKGLGAMRLWTEVTNVAGIASFRSAGFREVARFGRRVAEATETRDGPTLERCFPDEALWASAESSRILKASHFYAPVDYGFARVDRPTLGVLANRRMLRGWAGNAAILEAFQESPRADVLGFHPLLGDVRELLRAGPSVAAALGKSSVQAFLPYEKSILNVAESLGYASGTWAREAILCEKPLPVSTVVRRTRRTMAEINASKRSGYGALALLAPAHGHGHAGPHEDRWNP
ncbi:MAG: GNAT family N-acetyltransferase [Methanobacteriota archaeon]